MDLSVYASTTESDYFHTEKEEIAVVLKGQPYVELEGTEYFGDKGDGVRIRPNVKHRFASKSDQANHLLLVLTPAPALFITACGVSDSLIQTFLHILFAVI